MGFDAFDACRFRRMCRRCSQWKADASEEVTKRTRIEAKAFYRRDLVRPGPQLEATTWDLTNLLAMFGPEPLLLLA